MESINTKIPGLIIINPTVFGDSRGFFYESYQLNRYEQLGLPIFIQDNVSRSTYGVIRGLHYQKQHTQGKLMYVTRGAILDVALDVRKNSPTFKQWVSVELNDKNHSQLYIPPGFAHGFCVLSLEAEIIYKCTDFYDPASEITIRWDDPDLNINWPVTQPVLSQKDQQGKFLRDIPTEDFLIVLEK